MPINWKSLVTKYKGLWVGLREDEKTVIASGKTVRDVLTKAEANGTFRFERHFLMTLLNLVTAFSNKKVFSSYSR